MFKVFVIGFGFGATICAAAFGCYAEAAANLALTTAVIGVIRFSEV